MSIEMHFIALIVVFTLLAICATLYYIKELRMEIRDLENLKEIDSNLIDKQCKQITALESAKAMLAGQNRELQDRLRDLYVR